ncbi:MAG: hypothetical protein QRY72_02325 [Candidatus Rhabdochlamydia sp.]
MILVKSCSLHDVECHQECSFQDQRVSSLAPAHQNESGSENVCVYSSSVFETKNIRLIQCQSEREQLLALPNVNQIANEIEDEMKKYETVMKATKQGHETLKAIQYYQTCLRSYPPSKYQEPRLMLKEKVQCKNLLIEEIHLNPSDPEPYRLLAQLLNPREIVKVGEQEIGKKALLLKAIELNPQKAKPYQLLAKCLREDKIANIPQHLQLSIQELLQLAHEYEPTNSDILCDLAHHLGRHNTVVLSDQKTYSAKELLILAIHHEPYESRAYSLLAYQLLPGIEVKLQDGSFLNPSTALLKSLEFDPLKALQCIRNGYVPSKGNVLNIFNL